MLKYLPYLLLVPLLARIPISGGGIDMSLFAEPERWGYFERENAQLLIWLGMVVIGLAFWVWQYNKPFAGLIILSVASSMYPVYRGVMWIQLLCVLFGAVWYLIWVKFGSEKFYNAICVICLVHVGVMVLQYYELDYLFCHIGAAKGYDHRVVGFFSNVNFASAFIAVCLPAFFRKGWVYLIPVCLVGLVLAKTTGGMLAALAGTVVYLFITNKYRWYLILLVCLAGLYFLSLDHPSWSRAADWSIFSGMHRDGDRMGFNGSPDFFGIGLGSFIETNIIYKGVRFTHVHNEFLEGLLEMGWLTIPIYLAFLYHVVVRFKGRSKEGAAIVIGSVVSFVSFPIHTPTIAAVLLAWLAMFDRKRIFQ